MRPGFEKRALLARSYFGDEILTVAKFEILSANSDLAHFGARSADAAPNEADGKGAPVFVKTSVKTGEEPKGFLSKLLKKYPTRELFTAQGLI